MRRLLVVAVALVAMLAGAFALPASAAADFDYHPSDADFADCPSLPATAKPETWNCFFIITVGGALKLGKLDEQAISKPLRITVAQGQLQDGTTAAAFGAVRSEPMKVPGGLLGPPFNIPPITNLSVQTMGTGRVDPGFIFPSGVGTKIKLINPILGSKCFIGSNSNPVLLAPEVKSLEFTEIDGIGVIKILAEDTKFAVPAASGCGLNLGLINKAVNLRAGLPSASGNNKATLRWFVRLRGYPPS